MAVFKPLDEEGFVREGLSAGEGAVRELAAYQLDSMTGNLLNVCFIYVNYIKYAMSDGFSNVPPTALAILNVDKNGNFDEKFLENVTEEHFCHLGKIGKSKRGAVQRFISSKSGRS